MNRQANTGTLGKAMDIVEIIAEANSPPRFSDILRRTGQPRGTLHRQMANLLNEEMIALNPDQTYSLGIRLLKLASQAWSTNGFRTAATRGLNWLHQQTDETTHLAVLRGAEVIYLDKVESGQSIRMHSQIGKASPVYCTGIGKAALSRVDDTTLESILSELSFSRFTPHTITNTRALREELDGIRARGIAFDNEEHEIGICCVAAPVVPISRSFYAGVSVTGPVYRVDEAKWLAWQSLVPEAARLIVEDVEILLGPGGRIC
ncbi:IclR family transcriptional regulator [Kushneria indalinina]|uniref:HTH-type transcriptional repressor AllR n=1 Tax=Kushneria indalinina DSM 14324 TaxID=1122140 RepID=A0A3D9DSX3_9GAMM|nr:IclR family transcriptional regulator [Kushneria indalinina]REC93858.1 IclR family transcriptional regulator [Kushneria indalinina DSM 14324]